MKHKNDAGTDHNNYNTFISIKDTEYAKTTSTTNDFFGELKNKLFSIHEYLRIVCCQKQFGGWEFI